MRQGGWCSPNIADGESKNRSTLKTLYQNARGNVGITVVPDKVYSGKSWFDASCADMSSKRFSSENRERKEKIPIQ